MFLCLIIPHQGSVSDSRRLLPGRFVIYGSEPLGFRHCPIWTILPQP